MSFADKAATLPTAGLCLWFIPELRMSIVITSERVAEYLTT